MKSDNIILMVEIPSAMGRPFIVDLCENCSQMILIHPDHRRNGSRYLCEACDDKTSGKYMKFLKLKL